MDSFLGVIGDRRSDGNVPRGLDDVYCVNPILLSQSLVVRAVKANVILSGEFGFFLLSVAAIIFPCKEC